MTKYVLECLEEGEYYALYKQNPQGMAQLKGRKGSWSLVGYYDSVAEADQYIKELTNPFIPYEVKEYTV